MSHHNVVHTAIDGEELRGGRGLDDFATAAKRRSRAQLGRAEMAAQKGRDGAQAGYDPTEAEIALASLALLRLPARSAESKNSLPFGRRGGVELGLLSEPRRSSLFLDLACRLESRTLHARFEPSYRRWRVCPACRAARLRQYGRQGWSALPRSSGLGIREIIARAR